MCKWNHKRDNICRCVVITNKFCYMYKVLAVSKQIQGHAVL